MDSLIDRLRAVSETGCDPDLPYEAADAIVALRAERDALAAKIKELEGQKPAAWAVKNGWVIVCVKHSEKLARAEAERLQKSHDLSGSLAAYRVEPLYAIPVLAEPVNARLAEALKKLISNDEQAAFEEWLSSESPSGDVESVQRQWEESSAFRDALESTAEARDAISAAEAQPKPLITNESVNERLLEALKSTAQTLAWTCFGECRGFSAGLLSPNEAVEMARSAIAAAEAKQAEPVRLTLQEINDLFSAWVSRSGACSTLIKMVEAAVLRANGFKVEG